MGDLVSGAVVVVPFPFTTLTERKLRPAVVLSTFPRGDVLLCQVTSKSYGHPYVLALEADGFASGGLPRASWILPHRLVTAHESLVERVVGTLAPPMLADLRRLVCRIVQGESVGRP